MQEFAVKVDQGFLVAVLSMFETLAADDESHRLVAFQRDCEAVDKNLMADMVHTTVDTAKNFYDMLHFSPLKVCVQPLYQLCIVSSAFHIIIKIIYY